YALNQQGDVVAILNTAGEAVVEYTYDAWGNVLSVTGSMASTLGQFNPLRYRGYVYDNETALYYLQSRYYDPEIGRFINADDVDLLGANGDFTSLNLYAYCGNNPVVRKDTCGDIWETVFDVISLGASIVEVCINPSDLMAWAGLAGDVADLIPIVTGVGETVRAIKVTSKVADKATDAIDAVSDANKVVKKSTKNIRSTAVKKAWKNEASLVQSTGIGTRNWTKLEVDELLTNGKVKGYVGHHMKSVKGYPELAGDPLNIQFLTRKEHLLAHRGNWRNITHGRYVP
ncbi:MAG: hypothetical protein IKD21_00345, partial [Clostridia bacterium]|nr:hypothetical protein [Clostridia bacterium]